MSKEEKKLKAHVEEYFEKYMCVSFDKFIENWEEQEEISKNQDKEIERLNNIINELDDMFYETFRISQNGYYSISEWELKEFTDKIKELKGSDKE